MVWENPSTLDLLASSICEEFCLSMLPKRSERCIMTRLLRDDASTSSSGFSEWEGDTAMFVRHIADESSCIAIESLAQSDHSYLFRVISFTVISIRRAFVHWPTLRGEQLSKTSSNRSSTTQATLSIRCCQRSRHKQRLPYQSHPLKRQHHNQSRENDRKSRLPWICSWLALEMKRC